MSLWGYYTAAWVDENLNVVWYLSFSRQWEGHHRSWPRVLFLLLLHPLQAHPKQRPWLAEHWVPERVRHLPMKSFSWEWIDTHHRPSTCVLSCPAATPTSAAVVEGRWCLWPVVDVFTMALSNMSCSTLWDSTMSRLALTGTTTSKSCCRMFSLVTTDAYYWQSRYCV